ncbi:MAG: 16S rRNA (cytidine(1402)-2'-O)-methyltransferase [Clostridia bacterium]|nr:16S rRNA (cytidine(1402)-2'-O)-methyltransferase [Clostridia bacterium]
MSSIKNHDFSQEKNAIVGGTLYLVATPIGNLADLSERAIKVLSEVDFIAAEDTRNSQKLLSVLGISKPMVSYFEHNKRERGEQIIERLQAGESCALVTDAGTPAVSDPGADLVVLCAERGVTVTSIPGCCAAITALTLSALPTGRFTFEGFLSTNKAERREHLADLKKEKRTMILHEAPHKLRTTLSDLADAFGGSRRIALCRELTKLNEQIERTTLDGAMEIYAAKEPRGEYVLVIEGASESTESGAFWQDMSIPTHVQYYVDTGMSEKDAIKAAAKDRGVHKNEVYSVVVEQKNAQK